MKIRITAFFLICLILISQLIGCSDSKSFSHCELTLVLDKDFSREESEEFDLLLSNGELVLGVNRISFAAGLNQGISDTYTDKGFAAFFMHESGKSENLLMHGSIPYYTYTENGEGSDYFYTVTFYRSKHAYFTVAYVTESDKKELWSERILKFAEAAYFNDAEDITVS